MDKSLIWKKGTIVDSTILAALSSTKNQKKERDPGAHQVKKGNTWHFGYKAHIGVDKGRNLAHTVEVTGANTHDVTMVPKLLTREEATVYRDSGSLGAEKCEDVGTRNKSGKGSSTRPTADHHKARITPSALRRRSSAGNTSNLLSEQRSLGL